MVEWEAKRQLVHTILAVLSQMLRVADREGIRGTMMENWYADTKR